MWMGQLINLDSIVDHLHQGVVGADHVVEVILSGLFILDFVPQFPEVCQEAVRGRVDFKHPFIDLDIVGSGFERIV